MENIKCRICGKEFAHLGSHITHGHKMLTREYKEMFGLDFNYPLISEEVKIKKQIAFEADREKYIKNLRLAGSKYYFKKGVTNRTRFSEQSYDRVMSNLEKIEKNKRGSCPVCRMRFEHIASHLYNKHGLVVAKK